VCDFAKYFTGEKKSASTISTVWAEVRFVPHVVALYVLTRFRSQGLLGET